MGEKIKKPYILLVMLAVITLTWISCAPPTDVARATITEVHVVLINNGPLLAAINKSLGYPASITNKDLESIPILNVNDCGLESLEGIQYLKNLQVLNLSNQPADEDPSDDPPKNTFSDLSPLIELSKLISLDLSGNIACINSIGTLNSDKLSSLQILNLSRLGTEALKDDLSHLPALKSLNLSSNNIDSTKLKLPASLMLLNINEVSSPRATFIDDSLTNLTAIYAASSGLTALGPIKSSKLSYVDLRNCSSLGSINFTNLDTLLLTGVENLNSVILNNISFTDLSSLAASNNLTFVKITNCPNLSDASALSGKSKLGYLDLSNTNVSSISFLSGMPNLSYVDLNHTPVTNVDSLTELSALSFIDLSYCPVTNIDVFIILTNLSMVKLNYCKVKSLTALVSNGNFGTGDTLYVVGNPDGVTWAEGELDIYNGQLDTLSGPTKNVMVKTSIEDLNQMNLKIENLNQFNFWLAQKAAQN